MSQQRPGYEPSEQEARAIRHKARIEEFLADDAVKEAFARVEQDAIHVWRTGKTVEEREKAHAIISTIDSVQTSFRITIERGQRASFEVEGKRRRGER